MDGLIELLEHRMLIRSEALLLLKQLGQDIQKHLQCIVLDYNGTMSKEQKDELWGVVNH